MNIRGGVLACACIWCFSYGPFWKDKCFKIDYGTYRWILLVPKEEKIVIYEALCFDIAQGQMNGAPNETQTHSCSFSSLVC